MNLNNYMSDEDFNKLHLKDEDAKKIFIITENMNNLLFENKGLFLKVEEYRIWERKIANKISIFAIDVDKKEQKVGDFQTYDGEIYDIEFENQGNTPYQISSYANLLAISNKLGVKKEFNSAFNNFKIYGNTVHKIFRPKHRIMCSMRFEENNSLELKISVSNNEENYSYSRIVNKEQLLDPKIWLQYLHYFYELKNYISIEDFQNEPLDLIESNLKLMKY